MGAYLDACGDAGKWSGDLTDDAELDGDLPAPEGEGIGTGGSNTWYRMREGIERFMITDINNPAGSAKAQTEVHVMWDYVAQNTAMFFAPGEIPGGVAIFNHAPGGANVLYMDGHVEFQKFPGGKWPAHEAAAWALGWG